MQYPIAGRTPQPLDRHQDPHGFAADWKAAKPPLHPSSSHHIAALGGGTAKLVCFEFNLKGYMTAFITSAPLTMATKAERMIQEAGEHEGFISVGCLGRLPTRKPDCPLLFNS